MANSGSVGGRRGGKVESEMDMSKAKSYANAGSNKPNLNAPLKPQQDKVTNKPNKSKAK